MLCSVRTSINTSFLEDAEDWRPPLKIPLTDDYHSRIFVHAVQGSAMADVSEVVARSMSINEKLGPRLQAAADQNAILRIGWTNAGDPVPKNGELGLCPALPDGARIRALGVLGSWVAAFGKGGSFTLQGDAGSYLGAANQGTTIVCERMAGNFTGYMMNSGTITVLDGSGSDSGAMMAGGVLIIRGASGPRIGGGMSDGLIVIHGDVGPDPGAGMTGGRIIINGRCPTPPPGVVLRPLKKKEVTEINALLDDESLHVPSDAVCLTPQEEMLIESVGFAVSSGDLSQIGLLNDQEERLPPYATVDTVALVGIKETVQSLALPLPLLPMLEHGTTMLAGKNESDELGTVLNRHPALVEEKPRAVDLLMIQATNLLTVADDLPKAGGFAMDIGRLPPMNAEQIDGLLVALRALIKPDAPVMFIDGISRIQSLHEKAAYHSVDVAMARIEDGSGLSEAASLPMMGRSAKAHLSGQEIQTGLMLGFAANAHDLAVLVASGVDIVSCETPMAETQDIGYWLQGTQGDLSNELRRIGLNSIDMLDRKHLRALDHETASVSGLRLAGYGRPLPHWFAR